MPRPFLLSRRSFVIERQQAGENFLIRDRNVPLVSGEDCFVEALVREIEPRQSLVFKHFAEIEKVLLRGRALGQFNSAPFGSEFRNVH